MRKGRYALYTPNGRLECWSNDLAGLIQENNEDYNGKGRIYESHERSDWPEWVD